MFIKKDLRKIPTILEEEGENLQDLKLQRRQNEFQGSVRILCQPVAHTPALARLKSLSLYDCGIQDITGLGDVCTQLETLNLGRNPIQQLFSKDNDDTDSFSVVLLPMSLKRLLMDDCQVQGPMPAAIQRLEHLEELRMANNQINEIIIPGDNSSWKQLNVLGMDHNQLTSVPDDLFQVCSKLQTLLLRSNQLTALPESIGMLQHLQLLHVSSNQLTSLPSTLVHCTSLTHVYANGNPNLSSLDDLSLPTSLVYANFAHCQIQELSASFQLTFGKPSPDSGLCVSDNAKKILLIGNPVCLPNPSPRKKTRHSDNPSHDSDVIMQDVAVAAM